MRTKHDTPYYKKVYKRDTKNLKILIGHGGKTPKYAKKGGPFKLDPPKRRPVGKLSAPPMVLGEDASKDFNTRFLEIKQATFTVKMKKKVDPFFITVLKKDKTYNGIIKDQNVTITNTEKGSQTITKKEFLEKLKEYGELCNVVYCDESTITIGAKTLTFSEMLKPVDKKQPVPAKTKIKKDRDKQSKVGGDVANRVAKDGNLQNALQVGFFEKYETDPYHPKAIEFSKSFYKIVDKSLKTIPDPDERQVAALTAVIFGTLGMGSVSAIAETSDMIPKELFVSASKAVRDLIGKMGPEFLALGKKAEEIVGGAAEGVKKTIERVTGSGPLSLPDGQGKKILFLGNSQTTRASGVLKNILAKKNYDTVGSRVYTSGKFDLVHSGDTDEAHPSYYHKGNKGYNTIQRLVKKLGGADKIGLISVNMGDARKVGTWQSATDKMIKDLRGLIPDVAIFWMGAPPIQKKSSEINAINARRLRNTLDAQKAVESNGGVFVNPFEYLSVNKLTSKTLYRKDPTMVHLNSAGIARVLAGSVVDNEEGEKESKPKTQGSVEKIRYEGRRAVKLPSGEIRAGGTPAWRHNNPGNLRLRTAWRFYGAVGRVDGYAVFPTPDAGERALDKYLDIFAWSGRGPAGGYTIKTYFKMYDEEKHIQYSNFVAKRVGVDVDTKTKNLSNKQKRKFKEAIKRMEGYKEGDVIPA
jgi:hypothetical protein